MARPVGSFTVVLDDKQIEELQNMAKIGLPLHHCATIFGFSEAGLEDLIKRDQRVKDALSKGRTEGAIKAYQTVYEMAFVDRNPTMAIFWMKTRERWLEDTLKTEDIQAVRAIHLAKQKAVG